MTNTSLTQSQKRFNESLAPLFEIENAPKSCLFLKSSADIGVIRNGGRNGARFAPQSFLSTFKKFAMTEELKSYSFKAFETASEEEERQDFHSAQLKEADRISELLKKYPRSKICHIGGGHDHIFPLLTALGKSCKKIVVINIDAHADTRTDENFHSGTPFRQFARDFKGEFTIYQIGLHPFANSISTVSPLEKGKSVSLFKNDLSDENLNTLFNTIEKNLDQDTCVVFSLDADALSGYEVPGVSAVNPQGLTSKELINLWKRYRSLALNHEPIMGIYELNPVYDSLASVSMRTLGSFVYSTLHS